jgi:hypothetical protein
VWLAGFGTDNLVHIPVNEHLSMILENCKKRFWRFKNGFIPACIVPRSVPPALELLILSNRSASWPVIMGYGIMSMQHMRVLF